jgi:hypothetical protein
MVRDVRPSRGQWTDDDELAAEIELYGDLVVAASESEGNLTMGEIDRVLKVVRAGAWQQSPVVPAGPGCADSSGLA